MPSLSLVRAYTYYIVCSFASIASILKRKCLWIREKKVEEHRISFHKFLYDFPLSWGIFEGHVDNYGTTIFNSFHLLSC